MKPRVKFLTVIWGHSYIQRFCTLSLPSFVAPGNLPALANATDLEVVIMTCRTDRTVFEEFPAFKRLLETCAVRFVDIDDLVFKTVIYGVTLTLAYARPIIACGADMVNIHFVFMNADFVLADGSLRSLVKPLMDGRSIVLGPSFRAISEDVEPLLEKEVDTTRGVLSMPSRQMLELALQHPHQTTVAKMQDETRFHSSHPNQFFWKVDEHTVLGRYFLIFMLSIKPERTIRTVNSYCDYGLIPELCPSGDEIAMGDSDEFFMLELQERDKETKMLQPGKQPFKEAAHSLASWTTKEHRRAATHDIVFHSRDIPAGMEAARGEAQKFVDALIAEMGPVIPHEFHHYWTPGVEAWRAHRMLPCLPPELAALPLSLGMNQNRFRLRVLDFLKHSGCWSDLNLLESVIYEHSHSEPEFLLLGEPAPWLGIIMSRLAKRAAESNKQCPTVFHQAVPRDNSISTSSQPLQLFNRCIGFVQTDVTSKSQLLEIITEYVAKTLSYAAPGGKVLVIVEPVNPPKNLNLLIEDITACIHSNIEDAAQAEAKTIGNSLSWKSRSFARPLVRFFKHSRFSLFRTVRLFRAIPLLIVTLYMRYVQRADRSTKEPQANFTFLAISVGRKNAAITN